jgi:hypothetical protein
MPRPQKKKKTKDEKKTKNEIVYITIITYIFYRFHWELRSLRPDPLGYN